MHITIPLNIQAEDFFSIISHSIQQDMGNNEQSQIESGLTYEKKLVTMLGGVYNAKILIKEYTPNTHYSVEYTTKKSTITTTYRVEESADGILIHYDEVEVFTSKLEGINAKLMKHFYETSRKKQLVKKMNDMSAYIINQKTNSKGD